MSRPETTDWHAEQDAAMDRSMELVEAGMSHPSGVFRTWVWGGLELLYQSHLANAVAVLRGDDRFRLLDLGCGTGALLRMLADVFPRAELVGLDASTASLERARAMRVPGNVSYVEGRFQDARELGPFDFVVCSEVLEHVEQRDDLVGVAFDVLRPGGHLSLSTPSGWMWRRPSLALAWAFVNSPAGPRLRGRPTPRAVAERAGNIGGFYRRVRLRPEENWREALPHHPGVRPSVARAELEAAGFEIRSRSSSAWLLDERMGSAYRLLRRAERRSGPRAALRFMSLFTLLEALMNLVPPLRVFESRVVLLARRPDEPPRV